MDTASFFNGLPAIFAGEPERGEPLDQRWRELTTQVEGYTVPAELAVINHAASLLGEDECYLEVGTFKGRSLVAACAGNPAGRFVAIENFVEFGMSAARDELASNLQEYAAEADLQVLDGDAFRLLGAGTAVDRPVGIYFYDGEHTLLAHYLALAVVEPLLADQALVLVDDASWPVVQRAHHRFLAGHPGWRVQATWDARHADDPRWANGLHALVFERTAASVGLTARDRMLLEYQLRVQSHLNSLGWKLADRFPGPVRKAAGLVMSRSRTISTEQG